MRAHRILLIEDSAQDAELIAGALRRRGLEFVLHRAANEAECRSALAEGGWDIVLSDYMLPAFNGAKALSLLRESGSDTPFILVSGHLGEDAAVAIMRQGANDFVSKANLARLVPAIERELGEARVRQDRRMAQSGLQARERLLAAITGAIHVGLIVVGPQGRCQLVNPEAERLLERRAGDLAGSDLAAILPAQTASDQQGASLAGRTQEVIDGRCASWVGVAQLSRRDGAHIDIACTVTPFREESGAQGVLIVLRDITQHRRREEELGRSRERLRALSRHLTMVQEVERVRLARELHDELGQMLLAIKLDASWLRKRCAGDAEVQERTADLLALADRLVESVRGIASALRPPMLDDLGLVAALEWLVGDFRGRSAIECSFESEGDSYPLSHDAATSVFRMVQEGLTNVARHSGAAQVAVRLASRGGMLEVTVADDGRGFDYDPAARSETFGLLGMTERAASVGGRFRCTAQAGAGCRLEFAVPLAVAQKEFA